MREIESKGLEFHFRAIYFMNMHAYKIILSYIRSNNNPIRFHLRYLARKKLKPFKNSDGLNIQKH